ncbi:MAG: hypothetical protein U9O06_13450 [Euryarchaeota archaeon]|nr:hypothetical protein [Euryarchaeota archaeon]
MDRRTLMRAAAAATGSVGLAGCLSDDDEPTPELGDGPPRYDLPPYSELTPAETHTGDGVVVCHLRLSAFGPVQQALDAQRLPDDPVAELPLSSSEPVVAAVETITSYPFAAPLRQAITDAAVYRADDGTVTNHTIVATNETVEGSWRTNGTAMNGTRPGNETADNGTVENGTTGNTTIETTADGEIDTGIEVTAVTLIDDLLLFDGSYDGSIFENRYTTEFQQVDQQRSMAIYEDGSGRAFAVGDDLLVVPTENADREASGDTVLAHTLSGYINTLDRIVDDENGEWLFETTGPTALSLGVWGADEPLARIAETVGTTPSGTDDPVFDGLEAFVAGLEPTIDDSGTITGVETRFSGLFPTEAPTEDELQTGLASGADSTERHRNAPRVHLTALFGDT